MKIAHYGHFYLTKAPRGVMHPANWEIALRAFTTGTKFFFDTTV